MVEQILMADLKPPIILVDGLDVQLFSSPQAVEGYVEAIDIRDKVYRAFDSIGRQLTLEVHGDRVRLTPTEASAQHEAELQRLLRAALRHISDDPGLDLKRLVEVSSKVFGITR
jgi:hypothetical protein